MLQWTNTKLYDCPWMKCKICCNEWYKQQQRNILMQAVGNYASIDTTCTWSSEVISSSHTILHAYVSYLMMIKPGPVSRFTINAVTFLLSVWMNRPYSDMIKYSAQDCTVFYKPVIYVWHFFNIVTNYLMMCKKKYLGVRSI